MSTFGINLRNKPIKLGNVSQQSVSNTTSSIAIGVLGSGARVAQPETLPTMRTIDPIVIAPDIVKNMKLPPPATFIDPTIPTFKKKYSEEALKVSQYKISNEIFSPVEKNGISVYRPEIISMLDFKPIDGGNTLGADDVVEATEQLIKSQYQSTELRAITLQKIMSDINSKREFRTNIDEIKKNYNKNLKSTKVALQYFSDLVNKIDYVKSSLDPKKIPSSAFNAKKYLSLMDLYEQKMQYPKGKFVTFSDTKIINQLISDFRYILEGHSLSLLDLTDPDRQNDTSPILIDKTYTQSSGFTFSVSSIRSVSEPEKAYKPAFFTPFLNSLPSNPDDRIKLLTNLISKELRVSKQLSRSKIIAMLGSRFGLSQTGNPFDNILGIPGDTIFESPVGIKTLSNTTYMSLGDNTIVLPFESIYVDSDTENKTYIPGSSYFVDSILESTTNGFNTKPFITFANNFSDTAKDTKSIIESLLDLNDDKSTLSPESVFDIFLTSILEASSGLNSVLGINKSQAFSIALFKLANTDTVLKNQLFEYLLLLGLCSITSSDQKKIFERLAKEVNRINTFTYVRAATEENPNLLGGSGVLRPYLEGLAADIESRIFTLLNPLQTFLPANFAKSIPSLKPLQIKQDYSTSTSKLTGVVGSNMINLSGLIGNMSLDNFHLSFSRGEIKETLINNATSIGGASTNLCKEFIDIVTKLDQNASSGATASYMLDDSTNRTRFNFLSVSTQMLIVFEILSAFVNKYCFSEFNKGSGFSKGSILVETAMTSGVSKIIKDVIAIKPIFNLKLNSLNHNTSNKLSKINPMSVSKSPFSLYNVNIPLEIPNLPFSSNKPTAKNTSQISSVFKPQESDSQTSRIDFLSNVNSPIFGFGKIFQDGILKLSAETAKLIGYRKTLISNRTKLRGEDLVIKNILNIFEVMSNRLTSAKELVANTFTTSSMTSIVNSTGITEADLQIIKNPSQVRISAWILDRYLERTEGLSTDGSIQGGDNGFIASDRITVAQMNALLALLNQEQYKYFNLSDFKVKLLSVGIPSGFTKMMSDRVARASINETNFKDKQFDVIAIDVYKRDARFDDIVFKPVRFYFDLSLFPVGNFLPLLSKDTNKIKYSQILKEAQLRDYQSLEDKRLMNVEHIQHDEKYNFLSESQKQQMMQNHIESQLFELYIRLLTGLRISEETFTESLIEKLPLQDPSVYNLIIRYLKETKGKNIPNVPVEQLLTDNTIDQETKDTLRLLSYGNLTFQSEYIGRKILEPKLFDRVFHIPINVDSFPIDVDATISTSSGRDMYMKNSTQSQIVKINNEEYLKPRNRNDLVFEDFFVVIDTDLNGGV